jgi:class 3 adenylate cyclase
MPIGNVLVVDDNFLNRTLLATNLSDQGYSVETASNGKIALAMLRQNSYDVVLLDLLMPEMDGYQVLETMHSDPDLHFIPVIVISSLDEMDSVIRCIEMGATDYLTKPFDPVLLKARLSASLANKRLHDMEQAHFRAIQVERERADRLLLNILPEPIANQLKIGKEPVPQTYDVSVMFADVAGFTPWAAVRSPKEVLNLLNTIFSTFDALIDRYQIEKIKTIGDAYMAAGGLPIEKPGHEFDMAYLALEMLKVYNNLPLIIQEQLHLRIGIHCGPVIAGVIGSRKFIYDLWGDTVNTADRLQAQCEPGHIQISSEFYNRIKEKFTFSEKMFTELRSKGGVETYFLLGVKQI